MRQIALLPIATLLAAACATAPQTTPVSAAQEAETSPVMSQQKNPSTSSPDREKIAQAAIDAPKLQKYFHAEVAGRVPLRILAGPHVNTAWKLTKFGSPVEFVASGDSRRSPLLEFTSFDVSDGTASVTLLYAIEGVEMRAKAARNASGQWELTDSTLVER